MLSKRQKKNRKKLKKYVPAFPLPKIRVSAYILNLVDHFPRDIMQIIIDYANVCGTCWIGAGYRLETHKEFIRTWQCRECLMHIRKQRLNDFINPLYY